MSHERRHFCIARPYWRLSHCSYSLQRGASAETTNRLRRTGSRRTGLRRTGSRRTASAQNALSRPVSRRSGDRGYARDGGGSASSIAIVVSCALADEGYDRSGCSRCANYCTA